MIPNHIDHLVPEHDGNGIEVFFDGKEFLLDAVHNLIDVVLASSNTGNHPGNFIQFPAGKANFEQFIQLFDHIFGRPR